MNDLIERQAVIELIHACSKKDRKTPLSNLTQLILDVYDLPAVEQKGGVADEKGKD